MIKSEHEKSILQQAKAGNESAIEFLATQFSPIIRSISKSYFLSGGDSEDLYQLGLIGFYESIKRFDFEKNVDFIKFAKLCIHSKIMDAIKEASRKKHSPLNTAVGIDNINAVSVADPEAQFIVREQLLSVYAKIDVKLSEYEKLVLSLYVDGLSYAKIGEMLGKSTKSVANAITRIRNKLN